MPIFHGTLLDISGILWSVAIWKTNKIYLENYLWPVISENVNKKFPEFSFLPLKTYTVNKSPIMIAVFSGVPVGPHKVVEHITTMASNG